MKIDELISMPRNKDAIKKADSIMKESDDAQLVYHEAFCFKALCEHALGQTNMALKMLLTKRNDFDLVQSDIVVCYCSALIEIYFDLNLLDKAYEFIMLKKSHLSPLNLDSYTRDLMIYYDKLGSKEDALRQSYLYLEDDIKEKDRRLAYEIIIKYLYADRKKEEFDKIYDLLIPLYDISEQEEIFNLSYKKLNLMYLDKEYNEVINFSNHLLEQGLSIDQKIEVVTMMIYSFVLLDEPRKAMILDSDYQDDALKASISISRAYFNSTLLLYKKMNKAFAISDCEDKLKSLEERALKSTKETKEKPRIKKIFTEAPIVIEKVIKEEPKKEEVKDTLIKYQASDILEADVSATYLDFNEVFKYLLSLNLDIPFREFLRIALSKLNEHVKFDEAFFYYEENQKNLGYHYKLSRLYDKSFDRSLDKTINHRTKTLGHEVVALRLQEIYFNESIITFEKTVMRSAIVFPIFYDGQSIGSLGFFYKDMILNTGKYFEIMKLFSNIINLRYSLVRMSFNMNAKNESLLFLMDQIPYGVKMMNGEEVEISNQIKDLFELDCLNLNLSDFLNLLKNDSRILYKDILNQFNQGKINNYQIHYTIYNDKKIFEYMYLKEYLDKPLIISFLMDETSSTKRNQLMLEKLYLDSTMSYSYDKFKADLPLYEAQMKFSLMLINANNIKLYRDIYGLDFENDLIFAMSKILNEIKKENIIYHLEGDKFIVLFKFNDKRKVLKEGKLILDLLSKKLLDINKRASLTFSAGAITLNKKKINQNYIDLLNRALDISKRKGLDENNLSLYESEEYKDIFYEYQLELHISEAIDSFMLNLKYKQIVSIKEHLVYAYLVNLDLENIHVSDKLMDKVILKRNLVLKTDKYLISKTISELKRFMDKTSLLINVFIPIHKSTFMMDYFKSFFNSLLELYKIPAKVITFVLINDSNIDAKNKTQEFMNEHLNFASYDINEVLKLKLNYYIHSVKEFDIECSVLYKSILEKLNIKMIIKDVDTKKQALSYMEDFNLQTGEAFSKLYTIDNLINQTKN